MDILRGYGLGLNLHILLQRYWDEKAMVPNSGKYLDDHSGWREG